MFKRSTPVLVAALAILACSGVLASSALADTPAPGWEVLATFTPTNLPPEGGEATLWVYAYNVGAASSSNMTVVDKLPPGVTAIADAAAWGGSSAEGLSCTGKTTLTCVVTGSIGGFGKSNLAAGALAGPGVGAPIVVPVQVAKGVEGAASNRVTVSGGGAASATSRSTPVAFSSTAPGVGFADFDTWFSNPDGTVDTQAGSHPYTLTVAFALNSIGTHFPTLFPTGGDAKRIDVNLPPGVIGDPRAVPQCTLEQFEETSGGGIPGCPTASQVGQDVTSAGGVSDEFSLFNMAPPPGIAAQFAFKYSGINVFFDSGVRSGGDDGITVRTNEIPQRSIVFNSATIWGVPADASHNSSRGSDGCEEGGCAAGVPETPLLTMPTACSEPLTISAEELGTYQDESATANTSVVDRDDAGNPVGMSGCDLLGHFNPGISLAPDTGAADTPAGLTAEVNVPEEDEQGLSEPEQLDSADVKNTTVTLPVGVAINPGQATGLVACQPSEEALGTEGPGTEDPATCPIASKVGEDEIETPLLTNRLKGNVYILQPSPPNLQLLVTASGDGVNLKLVGDVHLNESTGQLTTTFKETPEFPFTHFKLSFSGGAQAALATPAHCGVYSSEADFTPWNTPFAPDVLESSSFAITSGPGGTPCEDPLPFTPSMTAGATTDQAGGYTAFTLLLTRGDGQQRIERLQFKTPEGLLGMLSKVPLCEEPQAAQGTCSSASQIGHTVAEAGPGPYPFVIPENGAPPAPIYLTGPYEGAPFGLSIAVPVVAGPFNLGTEVIRGRIEVDPHTAQLTITTTAFPKTVKGIPTDIRSIDAVIDRPEFMFNPTSCNPMSFSGTAYSFEGATAALASHFQMGSCRSLKFQPDFKVATQGKTSRADGASLEAKIVYPTTPLGENQASSQSNIQSVKVELPRQMPSRLTTLQKACTAAQFEANPGGCPAASVVGHATAVTPVLPVPLSGPAYFVSHGGEAFPSLIVVLQGYGVTVDLVGSTFISKAGITSSTFKQVPDVPISLFDLTLPEGQFSALAANLPAKDHYSFCGQKLTMPTAFIAQNGAVLNQSTAIGVTGCPKHKVKKVGHRKKQQQKQKDKRRKRAAR